MRVKIGNGNWIDDKDEKICLQLTRKETAIVVVFRKNKTDGKRRDI